MTDFIVFNWHYALNYISVRTHTLECSSG